MRWPSLGSGMAAGSSALLQEDGGVTLLRCGESDGRSFVIAVGLCGQLRAWQWQDREAALCAEQNNRCIKSEQTVGDSTTPMVAATNLRPLSEDRAQKERTDESHRDLVAPIDKASDSTRQNDPGSLVAGTVAAGFWQLVFELSSLYDVNNGRSSSHPYRCLTAAASDGRFAAATSSSEGRVHVVCTRIWQQTQELLLPDDHQSGNGSLYLRVPQASPSVLELDRSGKRLACGTREGGVWLWRSGTADGESEAGPVKTRPFVCVWGGVHADEGPVAALVLTEKYVVVTYRQAQGLLDGRAFQGEQSVVALSLESGSPVWRLPQQQHPLLSALPCAGRLWILHAASAEVDPEWFFLQDRSRNASELSSQSSSTLSSVPLTALDIEVSANGSSKELPDKIGLSSLTLESELRAFGAAITCELLCWHTNGHALAFGFSDGAVTLVEPRGRAAAVSHGRDSAAEVGAVCVMEGGLLLGPKARADVAVATASADGVIRAWCALGASGSGGDGLHNGDGLRDGDGDGDGKGGDGRGANSSLGDGSHASLSGSGGARLVLLLRVPLPHAWQPCALATDGRFLVCGGTRGTLAFLLLPLPDGGCPDAAAKHADDATGGDAVGSRCVPASEPSTGRGEEQYDWHFNAGAGDHARGSVRERRGAFDGWARTAAYEQGLQLVLQRLNQKSGHSTGPAMRRTPTAQARLPRPVAQAASARASSSALPIGSYVRIHSLVARPELNGCVAEVAGPADPKSGRYPLHIAAQAGMEQRGVKVKPENLSTVLV